MSMLSHCDYDELIADDMNRDKKYKVNPCDMEGVFYLQITQNDKGIPEHQFKFTKEQAIEFYKGVKSAMMRAGIKN